ncbi:MAG: rod shape-determining protein, partial [Deltaproteobacteria bacterium]|nr:rod shape-determining protein [Deltaproteobacteria bacterium]
KKALENTPPELSADIMERGITLAGGGALLQGLDKRIQEEIGINVNLAPSALSAVVEGTGSALDKLDYLKGLSLNSL